MPGTVQETSNSNARHPTDCRERRDPTNWDHPLAGTVRAGRCTTGMGGQCPPLRHRRPRAAPATGPRLGAVPRPPTTPSIPTPGDDDGQHRSTSLSVWRLRVRSRAAPWVTPAGRSKARAGYLNSDNAARSQPGGSRGPVVTTPGRPRGWVAVLADRPRSTGICLRRLHDPRRCLAGRADWTSCELSIHAESPSAPPVLITWSARLDAV